MQVLQEIKEFAGEHDEYRGIFEDLRRDYAERWASLFGRSWKADLFQAL